MIKSKVIISMALMAGLSLLAPLSVHASEADILDVRVQVSASGSYSFDVTVEHADDGWDHYADGYDVLTSDGTVLATRVLAHPHVNEQPFTRSIGRVKVPAGVSSVMVRAHDKVHGYGGKVRSVTLPPRP